MAAPGTKCPGVSRPPTSFVPQRPKQDVGARNKCGHDGVSVARPEQSGPHHFNAASSACAAAGARTLAPEIM
jgi:hypothetical protein